MKAFIDSSFFISCIKHDDKNHKKAQRIADDLKSKSFALYTSYYIIDETASILSMIVSKQVAVDFLESVKSDVFPIILEINQKIRSKTYRFFKTIENKNIGMTDCYSALLMKENKIKKCFTFDKHFRDLGFEIL